MGVLDDFLKNKTPYDAFLTRYKTQKGKISQTRNLNTIARIFGYNSHHEIEWGKIELKHAEAMREQLIQMGYAPNTINVTLAAFRAMIEECWKYGIVSSENYRKLQKIKTVKVDNRLPGRWVTKEEIKALLDTCQKDKLLDIRDAAIINLLRLGLRASEVCNLKETSIANPTKLVVFGKGSKIRVIPLPDWCLLTIERWQEEKKAREVFSQWLINTVKGDNIKTGRTSYDTIRNCVKRRGAMAKLKDLTPHDLRRTFATELLNAGVDINTVRKLMGHARIETTALYDRRGDDSLVPAIKFLDLDQ